MCSTRLNHIIKYQDGQATEMGYDFQHKTIQDIDIDKKNKTFPIIYERNA